MPDVPDDHEDYEIQILMNDNRKFGPFPASFLEIGDDQRLAILTWAMQKSPRETLRPFTPAPAKEISQKVKDFVLRIMKLDTRNRPTTRQPLGDAWFSEATPESMPVKSAAEGES
ncbi:uncharacterized protein DSM5745_05093 [Aspergillus mulundensis]|uniref:Protein kinase domain-containing protein n=1 Tax=Aspergillus mulundensis TaxID=1810919 RepID=A0A3D8S5K6_9EURO|nr:Uncharacterized protein DSM5745_05093 [Aspergillus mulundensis]RDW81536.1 Uncharacterized protein DSM5745_05093 [Aspergillus mulundensis]